MTDLFYMKRAERLAFKALGRTSPNPIVGAVIVKNGKIIGEGFHTKAGNPHAEIEALRSVRNQKSLAGATLYVTLEPCSSYGRTPPCTEAILKSGIRRVVIGCPDPNPKHAGKAVELLRAGGLEVTAYTDEAACGEMNEAFFCWITTGKPFVLLKMASTLDGRIATSSGSSKWITGTAARKRVQHLRMWADAVAVGKNTFLTDTPRLTVRDSRDRVIKTPYRFVLSTDPALPLPSGWERFEAKTKEAWDEFLLSLGKRNIVSLLLEGGGELAASALKAGAVDKIEFHYAPKILCGRNSRPVAGGGDPSSLAEAIQIRNGKLRRFGEDFAFSGYVDKTEEK